MNSGLECDIEKTFNAFMNLTQTEMTRATKRALRAGAKELQNQTKSNLNSAIKTTNNPHWYNGKRVYYNDTLEDAVRIGKFNTDFEEEISTSVHIYGTRDKNSGTYRARFLEKGTKDRYARKGRNRNHELITLRKPKYLGHITGRWFFKNAQTQVLPNLSNIYMSEIEKTINKLNNTNI